MSSLTHSPSASSQITRKALKVADLKTVLRNASLPVPPRANKADLIAKILVEPAAVDAYNALHNPTEVVPQQDAPFEPTSTKLVLPAEPPAGPPLSPEVQVRYNERIIMTY